MNEVHPSARKLLRDCHQVVTLPMNPVPAESGHLLVRALLAALAVSPPDGGRRIAGSSGIP